MHFAPSWNNRLHVEDSGILGCCAVLLIKHLPVFRRILLSSDLVSSNTRRADHMIPKKETLQSHGNYLSNGTA